MLVELFSVLTLLSSSSSQSLNLNPVVTTIYGPIRGYTTQIPGINDKKFAQVFLGVPYTMPPVGNLRFEKPQPPDPWTDVLNTTEFGPVCLANGQDDGTEDCLTLNVFAPIRETNDTRLFPVYFFIHGGAFVTEDAENFGKTDILTNAVANEIVVIVINYRLGPFGFLFTNTSDQIPNVGLLDQIAALEWVRDNIELFGGDSKRVTISGESAGGASVTWITMNPQARGLYAQTFPMSGSALDIWASAPETVINSTNTLIKMLKCENTSKVVECLKKVPSKTFWKHAKLIVNTTDKVDFGTFHPVFHKSFVGNAKTIAEAIKNAPLVPQLNALASMEWTQFVIRNDDVRGKYNPITDEHAMHLTKNEFYNSVKALFGFQSLFENKTTEAVNSIVEFYTNETRGAKYQWATALVTSISDVLFNIGSMREALYRAEAGAPVYFFLHECNNSRSKAVSGCRHGFVFSYLFYNPWVTPALQKKVLPVIVRFIKTGKPWEGPLVNSSNIPFFHGSVNGGFGTSLWPKRLEFWNEFYETFGYDWPSGSREKP